MDHPCDRVGPRLISPLSQGRDDGRRERIRQRSADGTAPHQAEGSAPPSSIDQHGHFPPPPHGRGAWTRSARKDSGTAVSRCGTDTQAGHRCIPGVHRRPARRSNGEAFSDWVSGLQRPRSVRVKSSHFLEPPWEKPSASFRDSASDQTIGSPPLGRPRLDAMEELDEAGQVPNLSEIGVGQDGLGVTPRNGQNCTLM
jgi:hypothetical protein